MGFDRGTADDDTTAADRAAQPVAGKRARTDGLARPPPAAAAGPAATASSTTDVDARLAP